MPSLPIFSTFARSAVDIDVDRLTKDILGGRDTTTTTRGARTEVRGPDVWSTWTLGRGGVWSGDIGRMWRAESIEAPKAAAVTEIADAAFKQANLSPQLDDHFRLTEGVVRYGQVVTEKDGQRKASPTEAVYSRNVVVNVSTNGGGKSDALPLLGGGGKFTATVGDGGQVVGMSGAWRDAELVDEREVMSVEAALEAAGIKASDQVQIRSTRLGYYAAPAFVAQDIMFPVYEVRAEVRSGEVWVPARVRLIPATRCGCGEPSRSTATPAI